MRLAPSGMAIGASVAVLVMSSGLTQRTATYPQALAGVLLAVGTWSLWTDVVAACRSAAAHPADGADAGATGATGDAEEPEYGELSGVRVVAYVALIALVVYVVPPLGFFPAAGVLLVGGMMVLGVRSPVRLLGYTAVVLGLSYLLFMVALKLPLPLAEGF